MEIDHLLQIKNGGVATYTLDEVKEKLNWWIDTPQGAVWGDPLRGNKLIMFKHDPVTESSEIAIEAHIMQKLSADIPSIQIRCVKVKFINSNEAQILLETERGLIKASFNRSKLL